MPLGRTRTAVLTAVIVLAALGAAIALAVLPASRTPPPPQQAAPAPAPPSPTSPPPAPGPPVLAVKIDNVADARPPIGLAAADLIYVEPVEGGYSRLLAIFGSTKPPTVGPVRSARETDLEMLPQFGRPTLAYSGAAPELLPLIAKAPVNDASDKHDPAAYFRDNSRPVPHNLFVRPDRLPPGADWSPGSIPQTGPTPAGGKPAGHHEVRYPEATVGFDWSPQERRWLVSMDGDPYSAVDTGRLGPTTVVIQKVHVRQSAISDAAGNPSPFAESIGAGEVQVLRDGQVFEGTWSRLSADAGTTYTSRSGEPLVFAPGQVWIALSP
ncbi:Protein of unknown function (DUF3048) [Saccharopolyspora erythraea NRRL 2338]|uniref:Secreted protein n=2 Tax=Saccharopolyspora erythraea TaxID=1836 RepID=A4FEV7_SACEN|nr:DUF3048 domain-containing protein [Saccharopolyspora erythraea]EQD82467.1 hypothetical protein N599_30445 [Saccharopolyspora erythraea D]PFG96308.1 Protein of unknown function (DUF3048) [Saccharopolyspora erythraea NRRL 2338]QRK92825.1 DUF3048 domain-containing protein [Saccharopolyspora erythraea]CAM02582.1 secreted protein [Saccharopolyspora erythraea NRRL 2338]